MSETSEVVPETVPASGDGKKWYIVHTYSGFEKKVAESLQQRVQAYGLQNEIGEILILERVDDFRHLCIVRVA